MATKLQHRKQLLDKAQDLYQIAYGLVGDDGKNIATTMQEPSSLDRRFCRIGLLDSLYDLQVISRTAAARAKIEADLAKIGAEQLLAMQEFDAAYGEYKSCCAADGIDHIVIGHDVCSCDVCSAHVAVLASRI